MTRVCVCARVRARAILRQIRIQSKNIRQDLKVSQEELMKLRT
jgi:hypothetical protein